MYCKSPKKLNRLKSYNFKLNKSVSKTKIVDKRGDEIRIHKMEKLYCSLVS